MVNPALEQKYRLSVARFLDDPSGKNVFSGLGRFAKEVQELLILVFGADSGLTPRDLDREHVKEVMTTFLPGRLEGKEAYAKSLPDVVFAYLGFLAVDEGLASAWELTSAVEECRETYRARLADGSRRRFGTAAKATPDKRPAPKIGRNDPCFCGSGKKYKLCCLKSFGG